MAVTGPVFSQLRVSQPYSMGPAVRIVYPDIDWADPRVTPAFGTNLVLDNRAAAEAAIRLCFTAPAGVQRAARAQGVAGVVMIRPAGLAEALERARLGVPDSQGVVLSPEARAQTRGVSGGS